jgi:hypothetical protein
LEAYKIQENKMIVMSELRWRFWTER